MKLWRKAAGHGRASTRLCTDILPAAPVAAVRWASGPEPGLGRVRTVGAIAAADAWPGAGARVAVRKEEVFG